MWVAQCGSARATTRPRRAVSDRPARAQLSDRRAPPRRRQTQHPPCLHAAPLPPRSPNGRRAALVASALRRVNAELARHRRIEARAGTVEAAQRALAMRRAAAFRAHPDAETFCTADHMRSMPSRKRRFVVHGARIGSVSQASKWAQKRRDSRASRTRLYSSLIDSALADMSCRQTVADGGVSRSRARLCGFNVRSIDVSIRREMPTSLMRRSDGSDRTLSQLSQSLFGTPGKALFVEIMPRLQPRIQSGAKNSTSTGSILARILTVDTVCGRNDYVQIFDNGEWQRCA